MFIEDLAEKAKQRLGEISGETGFFMEFGDFSDFSTSLPLRVAKKTKADPAEVSKNWAGQIKIDGLRAVPEKGFINFFLTDEALLYNLENLFKFPPEKKTVVIDYSSPNIAKPFSVGHLRSTIIGDSLRRIFDFLGWKTEGINFLGDWGMQFGRLLAGFEMWPDDLKTDPIKKLLKIYVKFHEEEEKNPELKAKADGWLKRLEDKDKEALKIWKLFRKVSLDEFEKMYQTLKILPLVDAGESNFVEDALKLVDELKKKKIARTDDKSVVIDVEGCPPLILRKSDGTTIYSARDLAAGLWRYRKFKPDLMLYVVGSEQKLHFKQLFSSLKKCGVNAEMEHADFGLISLPEGKMSTRKGRVIFLEDVLHEAVERVKDVMKTRGDVDEKSAEKIGIGAVKFADLRTNRARDFVFTWNLLSFEGETGPYVQYSAVRAKHVCEKFGKGKAGLDEKITPVARKIIRFRHAVLDSARQKRPDLLANFLLSVSKSFNELYVEEKLGGAPEREWLAGKVHQVLSKGLELLGIETPEKM